MRFTSCRLQFMAVAVGLSFAAIELPCSAGFTVTSTRTSDGAVDVVVFSVLNTGGATGTKINGWDMTVSTSAGFLTFDRRDIDGDGAADVNVPGYDLAFGDAAGTFARLFNAETWDGLTVSGSRATLSYRTDKNGDGVPDYDPGSNYTNVRSARFVGVTMGAGESDLSPLAFINVVVPAGSMVTASGQLGGNIGPAVSFTAINSETTAEAAPEPATLGLLGAGAVLLAGRRRVRRE